MRQGHIADSNDPTAIFSPRQPNHRCEAASEPAKLTISVLSKFFVSAKAKCSQQEIVFHFNRINSAAFRNRALECIRPMCQIMFVVFMQRRVYRICFTFRIRSTKAKVTRQRIGSHNENGFCFCSRV